MSLIKTSSDGETAVLAFARAPANAFNLELVEELAACLERIEAHPPQGGLVLTGEGSVFSGGVDFKAAPTYGPAERARMIGAINRTITMIYALPVATVAAVNGHAIGGAFVVMLACDWRLAADADARLGLTEVTAGIPYPACPMEVVKAELAGSVRRVLVLTGDIISPKQAHALSIVDELVPAGELLPRAVGAAKRLSSHAAYGRVKEQLRRDTVERMRAIIDNASDPMLQRWV